MKRWLVASLLVVLAGVLVVGVINSKRDPIAILKGHGGKSATDPTGATSGSYRVIRGGSWNIIARGCRSAHRDGSTPGYRIDNRGFRVLRSSIK